MGLDLDKDGPAMSCLARPEEGGRTTMQGMRKSGALASLEVDWRSSVNPTKLARCNNETLGDETRGRCEGLEILADCDKNRSSTGAAAAAAMAETLQQFYEKIKRTMIKALTCVRRQPQLEPLRC